MNVRAAGPIPNGDPVPCDASNPGVGDADLSAICDADLCVICCGSAGSTVLLLVLPLLSCCGALLLCVWCELEEGGRGAPAGGKKQPSRRCTSLPPPVRKRHTGNRDAWLYICT